MKLNIFLLIITQFIFSQVKEFKFGKVSIAELEEKQHSIESDAKAAYIFKTGEISMDYSQSNGFEITTTVRVKLKIYKEEGIENATKTIEFFEINNHKEQVTIKNAVTYNLVDGKIIKTKLDSEQITEQKLTANAFEKKFTMPDVKTGSIIEYEFILKSADKFNVPGWDFQYEIPVNYTSFTFKMPEFFGYNPVQKGFLNPHQTKETYTKSIIYNNQKIVYDEYSTNYVLENVPSLLTDVFVNNLKNYRTSIEYKIFSKQLPNSQLKIYSSDWNENTKKLYANKNFGNELEKNIYFQNDIKNLTKDLNDIEEKATTIFNFVKQKMKWNRTYSYLCSETGIENAYSSGVGNTADINLMLTAMFQFVGIQANPILISTRENGIPLTTSIGYYNSVIVGVELKDKTILFDASDKFSMPNVLPKQDLNWFGRLVRKNGTSDDINLLPQKLSEKNVNLFYDISENGIVTGKEMIKYYENLALNNIADFTNEKKYLEKQFNNVSISDYKREETNEQSKPLVEYFSFKDDKNIEIIDQKISFKPMLFHTLFSNPFKSDKRIYPIDFDCPVQNKYAININIPKGYKVDSLPTEINIALPENLVSLKYLITYDDSNIQVLVVEQINQSFINADYYETLKAFFQKIVDKENEKIVLKKI